jgi:hypothetical protein
VLFLGRRRAPQGEDLPTTAAGVELAADPGRARDRPLMRENKAEVRVTRL